MKKLTDEEIYKVAQERFLILRQKLDISQREMSETIGYAQSKISGLESGKSRFTHVIMSRISENFNLSFDYFNPQIKDYEKIFENREKDLNVLKPPENINELAQENDTYEIPYTMHVAYRDGRENGRFSKEASSFFSWRQIIEFVAPEYIVPTGSNKINEAVRNMVIRSEEKKHIEADVAVTLKTFEVTKIMLQLIALGILKKEEKDNYIFLKLTPYGEKYMMDVCTVKRESRNE